VSGLVTTGYQALHKVLTGRWAAVAISVMVVAALLAAGIAFFR